MAISHPLTTRPTVFAGKIETTTGTPIALLDVDGAWDVFEADIKPDIAFNKRLAQGSYSRKKGTAGARGASVSLKTEVGNSGSGTAPKWADLLTCAGFTGSSLVYTMVASSPSYNTMTVGKYYDGSRIRTAAGCMFNLKMGGQAGDVVMAEWTGRGSFQAPTSGTIIAPTYPTVVPAILASATLTIGGVQYTLPGFEIDMRSKVALRPDISAASGYRAAYISDFDPVLNVSPEALAFATKDWNSEYLSGATAALNLVIGSGTNGIVTITAQNLQLESPPDDEDMDGVLHDKLSFQMDTIVMTFS